MDALEENWMQVVAKRWYSRDLGLPHKRHPKHLEVVVKYHCQNLAQSHARDIVLIQAVGISGSADANEHKPKSPANMGDVHMFGGDQPNPFRQCSLLGSSNSDPLVDTRSLGKPEGPSTCAGETDIDDCPLTYTMTGTLSALS